MPIDILMPSAGGDAGDATVARWSRRAGDDVRRGDVLLEVETDKAIVEVESPGDGVLARIVVDDGARAAAGAVIGVIAVGGEDAAAVAAAPGSSAALPAASAASGGARAAAAAAPGVPASTTTAATSSSASTASAAASGVPQRVAASPLARRLAQQGGIDLAALRGSGPNGRIVKVDVERALAAPAPRAAAPLPAAAAPAAVDVPHSAMRRVIAQRLSEAKRNIPHFYLRIDCDVDALLELRRQLDAQAGVKPSVNDFVVKAVALALRRMPAVNASWGDDAMRRHGSVDVSVAVATPGGLMTPIVRDADAKRVAEIGAEIAELAARAKEGRLKPEEYQGGGFTVSNLGMYGIPEFYAIVNPPQAAILAVGACEQRPVVRDGALAVGTRMTCTLSADHRVVDGALGAEFLATLRSLLEAPLALLV